jgi:hypothetical protein
MLWTLRGRGSDPDHYALSLEANSVVLMHVEGVSKNAPAVETTEKWPVYETCRFDKQSTCCSVMYSSMNGLNCREVKLCSAHDQRVPYTLT